MRKALGGILWAVFAIILCLGVGGTLALTFIPALQEPFEPLVCRDGETLTTYSHSCDDGTCTDFVCVDSRGQRRNVSIYFIAGIFVALAPLAPVAIAASWLTRSNASGGQVVMMPQVVSAGVPMPMPMAGVAGNPMLGGKALTIQGRDGPFVVQFEDDSMPLDEKIAILEKAHDAGQLTDQQLGEAIDEITRLAEWGE